MREKASVPKMTKWVLLAWNAAQVGRSGAIAFPMQRIGQLPRENSGISPPLKARV